MPGIKHLFVSALPDDPDPTIVHPSDWNADHVIEDGAVSYSKIQDVGADKLLGSVAGGVVEEVDCTQAGRDLLDDATPADQRTTLGLGTAAVEDTTAFDAAGAAAAVGATAAADLATHEADTTTHGITAFGASLVDDADATTARGTLGLGALATKSTVATGDIDDDAVTYDKIQNVTSGRMLGRVTVGAGGIEELTQATTRTFLGLASVATSGSAADLSTGILPDARMPDLTGDVTTSEGAVATTIANDAVTYAKMQNVGANKVLGSIAGGDPEEIACTSAGRALIDDADAAAQRTTLGLGSMAVRNNVNVDGVTITGDGDSSALVASAGRAELGSGLDGSLTFGGGSVTLAIDGASLSVVGSTYSLTRDIYATDLTVDATYIINPKGFRIFCTGTCTINGTIASNGGNGGNGAGGTGGAAGAAAITAIAIYTTTAAGGTGGNAGASGGGGGTNVVSIQGTNTAAINGGGINGNGSNGSTFRGGGGGGGAGTGGASGTASSLPNANLGAGFNSLASATQGRDLGNTKFSSGGTGAGGGSGGVGGTGGGGGGGAVGGVVYIAARAILGSGSIEAKGGNGGNGQASGNTGGGGAGGGGVVVLVTNGTVVPSVSVAAGSYGTGNGTGGHGGDGGAGVVYRFNLI